MTLYLGILVLTVSSHRAEGKGHGYAKLPTKCTLPMHWKYMYAKTAKMVKTKHSEHSNNSFLVNGAFDG